MPALLRLAHVLRDPQEEQLEARPAEENKAPVFDVWQYRYEYHKSYGSPEFDHDGRKDRFTVIDVKSVSVSADNLKVTLKLNSWKTGYVTAVRALDIRDAKGGKLWNDTFYYTLNQIPKR